MDHEEIDARIKNIVIQHLQIDAAKYLPDAHILDDLGADSLDVVELIIAIETEFDIEIPDEEAEKAVTVAEAVLLIKTYIAEKSKTAG